MLISLPEPCGEDWKAMKPTGCGRFCNACQKTVIDFTMMTDAEILAILRNSDTPPSGRFLPAQLDRPLTEAPQSKRIPFVPKIAAALLALQAFTIHSFAQGKKNATTTCHDKQKAATASRTIKGRVLDFISEQPVSNACVSLVVSQHDTSSFVLTDAGGYFSIHIPDTWYADTITITVKDSTAFSMAYEYPVYAIPDTNISLLNLRQPVMLYRYFVLPLPQITKTTDTIVRAEKIPSYSGTVFITTKCTWSRRRSLWQRILHPFRTTQHCEHYAR